MYQLELKTDAARDWIEENVSSEPWQWMGDTLVVDHHYIEDLELGMVDAGLTTDDVIVRHC